MAEEWRFPKMATYGLHIGSKESGMAYEGGLLRMVKYARSSCEKKASTKERR
jgi:hypothetical protein